MPADNVGDEIRHLKKDKGYPQDRAVAAALSMKRRGRFRATGRRKARKRRR